MEARAKMVQFNLARRELSLKIVYYGPALSGKTTNLQSLHEFLREENRSRLMVLNTQDDRTLFFDLLPVQVTTRTGFAVKLKIYTVPGQVIHNATRKLVLAGADAVAFIADSQRTLAAANTESWQNLHQNLTENRIAPDDIPIVIQFNKRDLPDIRSDEEIISLRAKSVEPVYTAVALTGQGVCETFFGLLDRAFSRLDEKHDIEKKFGLYRSEFIANIFTYFDDARIGKSLEQLLAPPTLVRPSTRMRPPI